MTFCPIKLIQESKIKLIKKTEELQVTTERMTRWYMQQEKTKFPYKGYPLTNVLLKKINIVIKEYKLNCHAAAVSLGINLIVIG